MSRILSGGRSRVIHALRSSSRNCTVSWPLVMIVEGLVSGRLLPLKLRWPLLEKRSNSFIAVIGKVTTNLLAHFVVERLRKFLFPACKKRLLHRADRQ